MLTFPMESHRHEELRVFGVLLLAVLLVIALVSKAGGTQPPPPAPQVVEIVSPVDGIFCAAPYPGAPPFVAVGSEVYPNTIVAMVQPVIAKVPGIFYVPAGVHGTIVEVVAADNEVVTVGQPLFRVAPRSPAGD